MSPQHILTSVESVDRDDQRYDSSLKVVPSEETYGSSFGESAPLSSVQQMRPEI